MIHTSLSLDLLYLYQGRKRDARHARKVRGRLRRAPILKPGQEEFVIGGRPGLNMILRRFDQNRVRNRLLA